MGEQGSSKAMDVVCDLRVGCRRCAYGAIRMLVVKTQESEDHVNITVMHSSEPDCTSPEQLTARDVMAAVVDILKGLQNQELDG